MIACSRCQPAGGGLRGGENISDSPYVGNRGVLGLLCI